MIPKIDGVNEVFLLAGFALVVQGADLFGFLTSRAIRLLGIISYPIYLVHGVVYYMAMKLRGGCTQWRSTLTSRKPPHVWLWRSCSRPSFISLSSGPP
jgi:hypothetical protein